MGFRDESLEMLPFWAIEPNMGHLGVELVTMAAFINADYLNACLEYRQTITSAKHYEVLKLTNTKLQINALMTNTNPQKTIDVIT